MKMLVDQLMKASQVDERIPGSFPNEIAIIR